MASYTVSNCLLKDVEIDKKYIADLLMVFTQQTNPFKVALDKSNRILEIYSSVAEQSEIVAQWLNLMTMKPSSFETINVDVSKILEEEDCFLTVCCATKSQQKIIVNSHETWVKQKYQAPNIILYNEIPVMVFDRDQAVLELNHTTTSHITAFGSVIATDKSTITDTKNNSNGK